MEKLLSYQLHLGSLKTTKEVNISRTQEDHLLRIQMVNTSTTMAEPTLKTMEDYTKIIKVAFTLLMTKVSTKVMKEEYMLSMMVESFLTTLIQTS